MDISFLNRSSFPLFLDFQKNLLKKRERKKKQEKEKNTSLEKKGKLLRVLLSGRWLPGNQG